MNTQKSSWSPSPRVSLGEITLSSVTLPRLPLVQSHPWRSQVLHEQGRAGQHHPGELESGESS